MLYMSKAQYRCELEGHFVCVICISMSIYSAAVLLLLNQIPRTNFHAGSWNPLHAHMSPQLIFSSFVLPGPCATLHPGMTKEQNMFVRFIFSIIGVRLLLLATHT